jgi:hypothetical protein
VAAPSFVAAGAGNVATTGTAVPDTIASTPLAGQVVLVHGVLDGTTGAPALGTITNVSSLSGSASSLTLATPSGGEDVGAAAAKHFFWLGRVTANGTVTVNIGTTGNAFFFRVYTFSGVASGTTVAAIIENGGSAYVNATAATAAVTDTGVTTNGADRLAVQLVAVNDDNALASFTGETGGDWTEAVAEFASATSSDGCVQLQTATIASAGTINGGSQTMAAADAWGVIGFAFLPAAGGLSAAAGTATETDSALTVGRRKARALGIATGTNVALPITRAAPQIVQAIGTAIDVSSTFAFSRVKRRAALTVSESNAALSFPRTKRKATTTALESNTAVAFLRVRRRTLGIATETDLAFAFARQKTKLVGVATGVNTALPIVRSSIKTQPMTTVVETDLAVTFGRRKTKAVAAATTTNAAVALTRISSRLLGVATATNTALPFGRRKTKAAATATGTNTAVALTRVRTKPILTATSTDTAFSFGRVHSRAVSTAEEFDVAIHFTSPSIKVGLHPATPDTVGITPAGTDIVVLLHPLT